MLIAVRKAFTKSPCGSMFDANCIARVINAGISHAQLGAPEGSPPTLAGSLYSRSIPVQGISGSAASAYGVVSITSRLQGNHLEFLNPCSIVDFIALNLLV